MLKIKEIFNKSGPSLKFESLTDFFFLVWEVFSIHYRVFDMQGTCQFFVWKMGLAKRFKILSKDELIF